MSLAAFYTNDPRPHSVYRVYDAADRLLYIGCSVDVDLRMTGHEAKSPWYVFHTRVTTEPFATREEAEAAEVRAIATEHPRWNIVGRSKSHPDGFGRNARETPWLTAERSLGAQWADLRAKEADLAGRLEHVRAQKAAVDSQIAAHIATYAPARTA